MSEPSEKKVVRRSVAIALGITCILLIAGIGGAMAYFTIQINNKDTTYNNYALFHSHTDSEFNQLNGTYLAYLGLHSHTDSEYDSLQSAYNGYVLNHHYLDSDYDLLQSIANLGEQQTILDQYTVNQGANTHVYVTGFQANYAGYLYVSMTSTTSNAYVIVEYWFLGKLFSVTKTIGTSGEAYFLLMPSSVALYAGNTNLQNGATDTITATYHY